MKAYFECMAQNKTQSIIKLFVRYLKIREIVIIKLSVGSMIKVLKSAKISLLMDAKVFIHLMFSF